MKLQKEELAAVASHIYEKIKEKNTVALTKKELDDIEDYIDLQEDRKSNITEIQAEIDKSRKAFCKKMKIPSSNYYGTSTDKEYMKREVLKIKTKILPTLDEIRKSIIMKSLFSDEIELKKFIEEIIAKY